MVHTLLIGNYVDVGVLPGGAPARWPDLGVSLQHGRACGVPWCRPRRFPISSRGSVAFGFGPWVQREIYRRAKRGDRMIVARMPATTPQKGAPILATVTPDNVTRKVSMAASRRLSSRVALARLAPTVGSSARAAMMCTNSGGKALSAPVIEVPKMPASK